MVVLLQGMSYCYVTVYCSWKLPIEVVPKHEANQFYHDYVGTKRLLVSNVCFRLMKSTTLQSNM